MKNKHVKAIKKPIVVDAYQATQSTFIKTLEGTMKANEGDWIITGIEGEQWPVKKEIFEKTYKVIEK